MIYVKLRSALSIWPTALAFLVMKSPYAPSHFDGPDDADSPERGDKILRVELGGSGG